MFIRNPQERILSAYRNKIEHPININQLEQSIWDDIRFSIISSYRRSQGKERNNNNNDVYPTFSEFIKFLYDSDIRLMNEHYKPMTELCQPCAVQYHYIGNFATLRQDTNIILDYLSINSSLFWDRGKHINNPTQKHVENYYSKLNNRDIQHFHEIFMNDILLYNYMFPSSNDSRK